ncbi:hypothetical protein MuYL_4815 [Mucilaginibacter xinganensis]|uniref:Uncharacterized protein n=1 Tax=Mucilaginibacter xinganensis TaxID=1234841 RepID=A0A223P4D7_9SPHI|nr:hypothetical protein MuYL_4815 [Mucilaginibacter xinganensis]
MFNNLNTPIPAESLSGILIILKSLLHYLNGKFHNITFNLPVNFHLQSP